MAFYEIEKGIPFKVRRYTDRRVEKPAWYKIVDEMEPGDSILVTNWREAEALYAAMLQRGVKLTLKQQPDKTYRVWLISRR